MLILLKYNYRNGHLTSSPLLQKNCGRNKTVGSISSHSHQLYVRFKSDSSISGRGFQLFWEETATGITNIHTIYRNKVYFDRHSPNVKIEEFIFTSIFILWAGIPIKEICNKKSL